MVASARQASIASPAPRAERLSSGAGRSQLLLWLLLVFLILEYLRPPVLVQFKLQMLISLVLPVLCFNQIRDRRWSWTLTCQVGVFVISAIGIIYARNNYSAYFTTRVLFTTVSISISMAWLLSRLSYFRRVMWAWTLMMTYVGVFGLMNAGFGPGGIIGDENELALACNTAIPMAYFGATNSKGSRRLAYLAIAVILLAAVVISNSRGGFLGLMGITIYIILISKTRIRTIGIILAAGVIFYLAAPQAYIDEILSIEKEASGEVEDGTGDARIFLWQAAFNMWKAHPLFGVGAGNARFHTGEFQPDWEGSMYSERDWSGTAIHSGVFEVLAELGATGIFFFTGMLVNHFAVLRRIRRLARESRLVPEGLRREMEMYSGALGAGMIGYLGSGIFLSVAYHPYAFYFSAQSLALAWGLDAELQRLEALTSSRATKDQPGLRAPREPTAPASPKPTTSLGAGLLNGRS